MAGAGSCGVTPDSLIHPWLFKPASEVEKRTRNKKLVLLPRTLTKAEAAERKEKRESVAQVAVGVNTYAAISLLWGTKKYGHLYAQDLHHRDPPDIHATHWER